MKRLNGDIYVGLLILLPSFLLLCFSYNKDEKVKFLMALLFVFLLCCYTVAILYTHTIRYENRIPNKECNTLYIFATVFLIMCIKEALRTLYNVKVNLIIEIVLAISLYTIINLLSLIIATIITYVDGKIINRRLKKSEESENENI